ncbi:GntR family transcriptional regulator [Paenibacillus aceris]|uniref:DNA-binding GntR family transcriptional regulator n=1 Tax=Paenibacillus aceris TaxID=869555 RepID=A0ABS4I6W2_9BACL|nr:GntR family transcriptional regulator [Paenibacillus aceris]MBP1966643.1 DNA-binding GntR family transcriptional regulator [Paenibacillus aceris]NHW38879.1 GntR family transcriptional regulator [Paenibacillus aceris]
MFLQTNDLSGSVREQVYEALKENMIQLIWKPGMLISETMAAEMMSVSRRIIREAFARLSRDKLVEIIPQKGCYITKIDLAHADEAAFIREQLEAEVIRLACMRMTAEHTAMLQSLLEQQELAVKEKQFDQLAMLDDHFHQMIFAACNMERTWTVLQQKSMNSKRVRFLMEPSLENCELMLSEHRVIVQAIHSKDPDQAVCVLRKHFKLLSFDKLGLLHKYPNYFKA